MSFFNPDGEPLTAEDARRLGTKLAFYVFLPSIVFSVFAVFVGLINWEMEGPSFFIWSMVALVTSIWLFRAARKASGRVLLISGAVIIIVSAIFIAGLAWYGLTQNSGALGAIMYFVIAGGFGFVVARSGFDIRRAEEAEREREMERNPYAELGSSPEGEGDRVG